jgi:hypothetical protein
MENPNAVLRDIFGIPEDAAPSIKNPFIPLSFKYTSASIVFQIWNGDFLVEQQPIARAEAAPAAVNPLARLDEILNGEGVPIEEVQPEPQPEPQPRPVREPPVVRQGSAAELAAIMQQFDGFYPPAGAHPDEPPVITRHHDGVTEFIEVPSRVVEQQPIARAEAAPAAVNPLARLDEILNGEGVPIEEVQNAPPVIVSSQRAANEFRQIMEILGKMRVDRDDYKDFEQETPPESP